MGMGDSLPEQSTTPLERAQWYYDRMVLLRDQAAAVVQEREKDIVRARERLDEEIPVDRSALQLSGGGAVTEDHRELKDNGQQKGYVVLSAGERAKGFVRPYRDAYRHLKCGKITTMSRDIAETYARDPGFYSGTFCTTCRAHFPVGEDGEFTWYEMDGREGPKVGT
jgi:hypothetical protein